MGPSGPKPNKLRRGRKSHISGMKNMLAEKSIDTKRSGCCSTKSPGDVKNDSSVSRMKVFANTRATTYQ